jgi:hypothetical protein
MNEIAKRSAPLPAQGLDSAVRFAQLLSDADLLPRQFIGKPANVLYAIEYGRTLGIAPVAAITGIHVIEGKPSASSGLIGGLVRQAGHKLRVKSDGSTSATAQIVRADDPDFTYEATWTLERAEQAGLCKIEKGKPVARDRNGKPTAWEKYPAAMLKARAITEVARDACEDVLFGLHYTPEELGAVVDQDGEPVDAPVQPLRVVEHQVQQPQTAAQGRDYLHEAREAGDADAVRSIYREAANDGATPEYLAQIAAVGKEKAAAEQTSPAANDDIVDAETVDTPEDEAAAAEQRLREAAAAAGLDNIDAEFEQSYAIPIAKAGVQQLTEMTRILGGAA